MPSASMAKTKTVSAIHDAGNPTLTMPMKTAARMYMNDRDLIPPTRSATMPPMGRTSDPANTHAAVKYPAITGDRPYWSLK